MPDSPPAGSYLDRFEEMKRYMRFGPADERRLRELRVHAKPHLADIAREFYERAREHSNAHSVFRDEEQITRLHATQEKWLNRILSGPYDAAYCEQSAHIGYAHVRAGLPQLYVFTTMALFRTRLSNIAVDVFGANAAPTLTALARILDLELALMSETYSDALTRRLRRAVPQPPSFNASARRDRLAIELASSMIIGLDDNGRVVLFNSEASRITGYAFDEVIGQSFSMLFMADVEEGDFGAAWKEVRSASVGDVVSLSAKCVLKTRAGQLRAIDGQLSRANSGHENEAMFLLLARDVTRERAMAAQLRRSEKLAAVGTLAAGLAHEIRNPLNGAQLHLTFVRRALERIEVKSDVIDAVGIVNGELQRLSHLVTDFLEFARPRELQHEQIVIQDLCKRCVSLVTPEAGGKVELELPKTPLVAEVDGPMLQQVLLNLLSNGMQAAGIREHGRVILRVRRRPTEMCLSVIDDGPGLSDPQAPIFDAFYSTKSKGSGLGLAIVHRIVENHGGHISVKRQEGQTIFEVTLPLCNPERIPASVAPATNESATNELAINEESKR